MNEDLHLIDLTSPVSTLVVALGIATIIMVVALGTAVITITASTITSFSLRLCT